MRVIVRSSFGTFKKGEVVDLDDAEALKFIANDMVVPTEMVFTKAGMATKSQSLPVAEVSPKATATKSKRGATKAKKDA